MKIINIGILAHVDAGKTTLTESLLYTSGAIAEQGNVDKGTTRTDTMILERQRGITIQAAVTSFQWHRCKVNIVDIPENSIPRLFDAFYRVEQSRSRKTGGSGLGLYIVQEILHQYGSECTVCNTQAGVKFSFII